MEPNLRIQFVYIYTAGIRGKIQNVSFVTYIALLFFYFVNNIALGTFYQLILTVLP